MSLDASKTRTQDVRNLYRFYTSTGLGRMITLQFLLTNWVEINSRYKNIRIIHNCSRIIFCLKITHTHNHICYFALAIIMRSSLGFL